jgi:hypothetical protein
VFCGFLAENQREKIVEHHREKAYMDLLLKDLQLDASFILGMKQQNIQLAKGLDSLAMYFDGLKDTNKKQLEKVYSLFYTWGYSPNIVKFSDRTISQLKSAGGMRLIRSQKASEGIHFYYTVISLIDEQARIYSEDMGELIVLSYGFMDKLYTLPGHTDMILAMKLLRENPGKQREFINRALDLKEVVENYNHLLDQVSDMGIKLSNTIKSEYKLN